MPRDSDVIIIGGGPTGLMLAGDLAAAGVSCTVVERRDNESNLTRAFAVHARTLELLDARGIAEELIRAGRQVSRMGPLGVDFSRLPTRFPYVLVVPQYETERVLADRARALGAEIRTGCSATGLRQDSEGVSVTIRSTGDRTETLRASYAVGADGARSAVRRALGLPFPGRAAVRSVMMCDVRLTSPPADALALGAVGDAFALVIPFGDGWYRVIAWNRRNQLPDTAPVDFEELQQVTRRALGTDLGMHDPRWLSRFHSEERQVPRYRVGRVFLAGDAAHVHSPAGGMGMNTGLQDAANLAWKLAATVDGWAREDLLDTYQTERHPVGRRVLRLSGTILRGALTAPNGLRTVRDLALRLASHFRPIGRRAAAAIAGIDVSYPAPRGAHPLTGRRARDVPLAGRGPRTLNQALRRGRFVLVLPPHVAPPADLSGWTDRVDVVTAGGPTRTIVLVRPDGYVAWAARDSEPAHTTAIRTALTEWCGPATGRVPLG
jgi:2-polyprenyl-6-methoxyphenol hydroxylase-like FAD-dependent oxidoreductase